MMNGNKKKNEYGKDDRMRMKATDWTCFCLDWNDLFVIVIMIVIFLAKIGKFPEHF